MLETETSRLLALVATALVGYFLVSLVPRVDAMARSYRKFAALTTLGLSYLVLLTLFLATTAALEGPATETVILALGVAAFLLFGLTLLYDVADDWLRLFADPEYNTVVEASMILALVVVLLVSFFAIEP